MSISGMLHCVHGINPFSRTYDARKSFSSDAEKACVSSMCAFSVYSGSVFVKIGL